MLQWGADGWQWVCVDGWLWVFVLNDETYIGESAHVSIIFLVRAIVCIVDVDGLISKLSGKSYFLLWFFASHLAILQWNALNKLQLMVNDYHGWTHLFNCKAFTSLFNPILKCFENLSFVIMEELLLDELFSKLTSWYTS